MLRVKSAREISESAGAEMSNDIYMCELCGSTFWRYLHEGDESNCSCEGECWRVCNNFDIEDGCDGIAHLTTNGRA